MFVVQYCRTANMDLWMVSLFRSSVMACQCIMSLVCFICEQAGFDIPNYLDDFMRVATQVQACKAIIFSGTFTSVAPSTVITCLGVQFDTVDMTMSMALFRLTDIISLLVNRRIRKSYTKTALQSLLGKLLFVAKCVHQSHIFVSHVLDLLCSIKFPTHHVHLTSEFRKDIHWWQIFPPCYNGISIPPPRHGQLQTQFCHRCMFKWLRWRVINRILSHCLPRLCSYHLYCDLSRITHHCDGCCTLMGPTLAGSQNSAFL